MGTKVKIEKCTDPEVTPKCPGCQKAIETLLSLPVSGGILNESNLVVCPHCHVVLGYGKVNYL